jgi:hypothetical protein
VKRAFLLLVLAMGAASAAWYAIPTRSDQTVSLEVSVAGWQRTFQVGEVIPLQLAFSSAVPERYQINLATSDRGGRMEFEQFAVTPAADVVDPLATYERGMGGGLSGSAFLERRPTTIQLKLNEWVWFTKPGTYKLAVSSQRVEVLDEASASGTTPITVTSNQITLRIVPPKPAWQERVYREAVRMLDSPAPADSAEEDKWFTAREHAAETLRFLGTGDAARALAQRLRPEPYGSVESRCFLGLASSPERAVARDVLEEALADPDHPISPVFLAALREVRADPAASATDRLEEQRRRLEKLVQALPNKRGAALPVSLNTALEEAWGPVALPKETLETLTDQLISVFDQLPREQQETLLAHRWEKIATPALLPVVQRYAQLPRGATNRSSSDRLSIAALKRWHQLDPVGARPVVIREIADPHPRFDSRDVEILPEEVLPEADQALAENFEQNGAGAAAVSALIARYATAAILPRVLAAVDAHPERWGCGEGSAILAYLLRVDAEGARVRLEKALDPSGGRMPVCASLFTDTARIQFHPVLETVAIKRSTMSISCWPQTRRRCWGCWVARGRDATPTAIRTLDRAVGSARSRANLAWVNGSSDRSFELTLARALVEAIAEGRSWLTDRDELQRLAGLNRGAALEQEFVRYLRYWDENPLPIYFYPSGRGVEGTVAQYRFASLDRLKEKLLQFPPATRFAASVSAHDSSPPRSKSPTCEIILLVTG